MTEPQLGSPKVFAAVLTYNAPLEPLASCVRSLVEQSVPVSEVLVIDNGSRTTPTAGQLAPDGDGTVRVADLGENLGVAGGYAHGMQEFLRGDADYFWAFDDDIRAEPTCLASLLAQSDGTSAVMPAVLDESTGTFMPEQNGWWGILLPRAVIEQCGFPRSEFFYGLEEQEYFLDRLPNAGFAVRHSDTAIVRSTQRGDKPLAPWKYYYLARNTTYQYLYGRKHIPRATRWKSLAAAFVRWFRDAWHSNAERGTKAWYLGRGLFDGLLGRLGKRVEPDRADRPWGN